MGIIVLNFLDHSELIHCSQKFSEFNFFMLIIKKSLHLSNILFFGVFQFYYNFLKHAALYKNVTSLRKWSSLNLYKNYHYNICNAWTSNLQQKQKKEKILLYSEFYFLALLYFNIGPTINSYNQTNLFKMYLKIVTMLPIFADWLWPFPKKLDPNPLFKGIVLIKS